MSLVVTGVTVAVLFATQRSVKQAYLDLFEEQFQSQIRYFSESRIRQLDTVAHKSELICKSPELAAAVQSGNAVRIYEIAFDELREYYKPQEIPGIPQMSSGKDKEKPNDRAGENLRRRLGAAYDTNGPKSAAAPFVRILDAKGTLIELKEPPAALKKTFGKNKRQEQLREFAKHVPVAALQEQEIGYLATEIENQPVQLRECIVTPIFAPDRKAAVGALLLGIPVHDFGEKTMFAFSKKLLSSGIWVDGKVYTETIPEGVRDEVADRVANDLKAGRASDAAAQITVNGVPHRLRFQILNPDSAFPPAAEVCVYSLAEYEAAKDHLRNLALEFGGAALLLGVALTLLVTHGFSKPIEELSTATRMIGEGDFSARVRVRSRDELGELASSFNSMAEGLALKEKYKSVLAQVADPDIAEELISGRVTLGGECRQVSVLFCDIRGFSTVTEGMPPAEVIGMLNEHMTALNRVVHEHCGVVDKFVGDMIMAIFGAPKSYGNDAAHAARCALAMIEERRLLNQTSPHQLEIGIGLTTGEVVAGCMGSADRLNYTVLGERVNLASRLCDQAGGMEVLIDEATRVLLPNDSQYSSIEPLRLKGFTDVVGAYKLEIVNLPAMPIDVENGNGALEISKTDSETAGS